MIAEECRSPHALPIGTDRAVLHPQTARAAGRRLSRQKRLRDGLALLAAEQDRDRPGEDGTGKRADDVEPQVAELAGVDGRID